MPVPIPASSAGTGGEVPSQLSGRHIHQSDSRGILVGLDPRHASGAGHVLEVLEAVLRELQQEAGDPAAVADQDGRAVRSSADIAPQADVTGLYVFG
ncbi:MULTISPECIES: hypothetical protein [unclassified Streptomyces]|uniref:hypothetical protein n=1 Tax=unclassified Streptomyces TaxID=2593676 RepID=UPI002034C71F|nr:MULTISPECIES: hypothetical protein [unclassified Streptomyces]